MSISRPEQVVLSAWMAVNGSAPSNAVFNSHAAIARASDGMASWTAAVNSHVNTFISFLGPAGSDRFVDSVIANLGLGAVPGIRDVALNFFNSQPNNRGGLAIAAVDWLRNSTFDASETELIRAQATFRAMETYAAAHSMDAESVHPMPSRPHPQPNIQTTTLTFAEAFGGGASASLRNDTVIVLGSDSVIGGATTYNVGGAGLDDRLTLNMGGFDFIGGGSQVFRGVEALSINTGANRADVARFEDSLVVTSSVVVSNPHDPNEPVPHSSMLITGASGITFAGALFGVNLIDAKRLTGSLVLTGDVANAITVHGGSASDVITGSTGFDSLYGRAGNDTITGGRGMDDLYGGTGSNTFVFSLGDSGLPGAFNFDKIHDFRAGSNTIDFTTNLAVAGPSTVTPNRAAIGANGVATFYTEATPGSSIFNNTGPSLMQQINDVAAAIDLGGTAAGEAAIWQRGPNAFLFVSDATTGVSANDVLIMLTGVTVGAGGLTIANGDITAIA